MIDLRLGDCRAVLRGLADASADAIVTDPPYEYRFMAKKWDGTGIAFLPETWAECLRVAKPGAHLIAFGGTRTHHRLMCAIEDGGWEIRDSLASLTWVYGSGFPKSLDVSKAIDKAAGAEREVTGERVYPGGHVQRSKEPRFNGASYNGGNIYRESPQRMESAPATDAARRWAGWGTALKPAWEPIVLARKPLDGTVAGNVQAHGTGALNIDGCRVSYRDEADAAGMRDGVGRMARSPERSKPGGNRNTLNCSQDGSLSEVVMGVSDSGRWPPNFLLTHHPDCCPCGTKRVRTQYGQATQHNDFKGWEHTKGEVIPVGYTDADGMETVEAWDCVDQCPVRGLDAQAGERKSGSAVKGHEASVPGYSGGLGRVPGTVYGDSGSVSRFYPTFAWEADDFAPYFYCPKASRAERGAGNTHPCVKPLQLMRWLARLVCPPGGTLIDPFCGSGSTLLAADAEGFDAIGCDDDPESVAIARRRLNVARAGTPLFTS